MRGTDILFNTVCCVKCGSEQGSGFLIAPNIVVTARHVVAAHFAKGDNIGDNIYVKFENEPDTIDCKVCSDVDVAETPIVLLELQQAKGCYIDEISDVEVSEQINCCVYGFFGSNPDSIDKIDLRYVRNFDNQQEYNISFKPIDERKRVFNGFSGAPVLVNGDIVGILTQENLDNYTAIRIFGICGLHFRQLLDKFGIKIKLHKHNIDKQQTLSNSKFESQSVETVNIQEIDVVLNKLFEQIKLKREHGQKIQSQEEVKDFLLHLKDIHCSEEKKAEFYYISAIWMLLDEDENVARSYYEEARKINPEIDDSVYCTYSFFNQGLIEQAKSCIKPINSIMKLNAYVACLVSEKEQLSAIQAVVKATDIPANEQTYRLLALAALNSACFDEGLGYIQKVQSCGLYIADISIIEALLYYWQVMINIYPDANRLSFAFILNSYFSFSAKQLENLQKAYSILEEQYKSEKTNNDKKILATLTWALVIISTVLPDKDNIYWLECFREYCYLHPLDISYCVNHKMPISDTMAEEFLALPIDKENEYSYAIAKFELLIAKEKYGEAKIFFAEYKELIAKASSISIDECKLRLMIECKDYVKAEQFLHNIQLPEDDRDRYYIYILSHKNSKTYKKLVKQALDLAKKTGLRIDFWNAAIICTQYKKWNEAVANAKEWWCKTNELTALEVWTEALYEKKDYRKCLQIINKAESEGDNSENIKQYKLNTLLSLGKNDEALKLAQSFNNSSRNPRLIVLQARLYLSEGKPDKAVQVLQSYVDKDLYDLEVYKLLIDLIKADKPDLAGYYANKLYLHNPDDEEVIKFCGLLMLILGQEGEPVYKFHEMLYQQPQDSPEFKMVTGKEILDIWDKQNEQNKKIANDYLRLKYPIHTLADFPNRTLSRIMLSTWNNRLPYFGRYGVAKNVSINSQKPLFLDYTSCLLLCKLDLFDTVCAVFSNVLLDSHIFEIWLNDINNLKDVQKHIVKQDIALSDSLKCLEFNQCKTNKTEKDFDDWDTTDYIMVNCAKENDAFIIEERPAGLITGKKFPADWWDINIQPCNLYAVLNSRDLLHPDYDEAKVDREKMEQLKCQRNIVLSQQVMTELLETNSLNDVFELFNVILPSTIVDVIHEKADEHRQNAANVEWLEKAYKYVVGLYDEQKLNFVTKYNSRKIDNSIYLQMLCDELNYISQNPVNFIIDDRFSSSYHIIGEKQPSIIISTYDLIKYMYSVNIIERNKYFHLIDMLLSIGYSYFVPPAEYLFSRLSLAECDSVGVLTETDKLRNIRKYLAFALDEEYGLQTKLIGNCLVPEKIGFFSEQQKVFNDCLLNIWTSDKASSWRKAAADWLLAFVGDSLCDINDEQGYSNKEYFFVIKQSSLLLNIIVLSNRQTKYEYINWLEPYILVSWRVNPNIIQKVAEYIAGAIKKLIEKQDNLTNEMKKYMHLTIVGFLNLLPSVLLEKILEDPQFIVYRQYCANSIQDVPIFSEMEDYLKEQALFDKKGIIDCNFEALEGAIMFVIADWQKNCNTVVNEVSINDMDKVKLEYNYVLSQYFAELAWYFPLCQSTHLYELKRTLSRLL